MTVITRTAGALTPGDRLLTPLGVAVVETITKLRGPVLRIDLNHTRVLFAGTTQPVSVLTEDPE